MTRTRLELSGRLAAPPLLGATPAGRAVLRLNVDCGERPGELMLDVVVIDGAARELASALKAGQQVWAVGALRAVRATRAGMTQQRFEVLAQEVRAEVEPQTGPRAGSEARPEGRRRETP